MFRSHPLRPFRPRLGASELKHAAIASAALAMMLAAQLPADAQTTGATQDTGASQTTGATQATGGTPANGATQATGAWRPYRALFGGTTANPDVHHSFDVTTSVLAGYDKNEGTGTTDAAASPLLRTGGYLGVSGGVAYAWQTQRVQLAGNLGINTRYYEDTGEFIGTSRGGAFGVAAQVGRRGRIFANQSVTYAPSYLYGWSSTPGGMPPGTVVGGGNYPLGDESVFVYDTTASAAYSVTRRGTIEGLGSYRYSDFADSGDASMDALTSYSVGARFRQGISRYAWLRLGYVYRQGQYGFTGTSAAVGIHDIDIGVDYNRALSLTRRTTFDFSTGSALITAPLTDTALTAAASNELQFRLVGQVGLTHEMGRTWRARVGYNRGVGFSEAFAQPVVADGVNVSLTGFASRRVDVSMNGSFTTGEVGLGRPVAMSSLSNSSFEAWNVSARTRYALGSMWAIYGEYFYYSQDLGTAVIVPSGVPSVLERQSIQVGLTLWVPLLRR